MALSGKRVGIIVVLTVLALSGLIALQVSLLSYALEIKEQSFRNNAMSALAQISHALTVADATAMLNAASDEDREGLRARFISVLTDDLVGGVDEFSWRSDMVTTTDTSDSADTGVGPGGGAQRNVVIAIKGSTPRIDSARGDKSVDSGSYEIALESESIDEGRYLYRFSADSGSHTLQHSRTFSDSVGSGLPDSVGAEVLSSTIGRMLGLNAPPLGERLDSINVDSIVAASMSGAGIDMEYAYGIFSDYPDSLTYAKPEGYDEALRTSKLRTRLFHQDFLPRRALMTLHFPQKRAYLWAQIAPLIFAEILFMIIIIACFAYTIRTILKQKKFSIRLVDFINNMTHEFKTPISTVALATEAIARPDVLAQKEKVLQFNTMIRTEINRMRNQAEKILQMATLEEGDIALALTAVDMHQVIREAVESVSLQIEHRGGTITSLLAADGAIVNADSLHVANIVHNLLDNAVKYSAETPHVVVRTSRNGKGIAVEIEDRGIGMEAEQARQAFAKYYRVPTGNVHNVKGFGLGLSYVKLMVEAHGGSVSINSIPGKGTTVTFVLPQEEEGETA